MKILQINSVCGVGSTGRIAKSIHEILITKGNESYIAYGRGNANGCNSTIRIGNSLDNYIHVFNTRLFDNHGFSSASATKKFIEDMENLKPDIVHIHNLHGYYIHIGLLFNYIDKAGIPVVWTLHDCWAFTGHCAYFELVECDMWKTGCRRCPNKRNYPKSMLLDNSGGNYSRKKVLFENVKNLEIVTPSVWLKELAKQSFLREHPIRVINNGINLNIFKPSESDFRQKHHIENKFLILGIASVWDERKGLDYFIKLSEKLDSKKVIVLVGVTDNQIKALPKKIIGIKKTESVDELAQIYSAADVYVNPTLEDNFPTTNIEALACGTPVITFNTGGSAEILNADSGVVVKKADVDGLLKAIETVRMRTKEQYMKYCLRRVKEYYDESDRFNEYIKLYSEILQ